MSAAYPAFDGTQACAQVGTEAFFPDTNGNSEEVRQAKAVCESCPFQQQCLDYALSWNVAGVWGGTTEWQRKKIRRKRGIVATPLVERERSERAAQVRRMTRDGMTARTIAEVVGVSVREVERLRGAAA